MKHYDFLLLEKFFAGDKKPTSQNTGCCQDLPTPLFSPTLVQKALITLVILLRGKNIALEGEPEGDTVKICTSRLVFFFSRR